MLRICEFWIRSPKSAGAALVACCVVMPLFGAADGAAEEAIGGENYQFCGLPFQNNAFGRAVDQTSAGDREHVLGIEGNHLNRDVQLLIRGQTSDSPVHDLAYVLRQVPNHYRALALMSQFQLKKGYFSSYETMNIYTADCYFRRALSFDADDPIVHMIYGIHLHKAGDLNSALSEYLTAQQIGPPNPELHYNLGLLYFDLKQYDAARDEADKAYELGFPLRGLKARLERVAE